MATSTPCRAKPPRSPSRSSTACRAFEANPLLAAKPNPRARRFPVTVSVALHALLIVVLLALRPPTPQEEEPLPIDIVFYTPPPVVEATQQVVVQPEPKLEPKPKAEPKPLRIVKPPEPRTLVQPEPPVEVPPQPAIEPAPRPAPAPAPKVSPAVMTGSFSQAKITVAAPSRGDRAGAQIGGFGTASAGKPQNKKETASVVSNTSFSDETSSQPREGRASRRGSVSSTGFEASAVAAPAAREASGPVKPGAFGDEAVVAQKPRPQRETALAKLDTPVEIVSKPKPAYTNEARELRIEGEVVLEVTFVASGQLRVLRILERLGHGLDEAAVAATHQIQFKPARRNGRAVDHTATLRVVFRLA